MNDIRKLKKVVLLRAGEVEYRIDWKDGLQRLGHRGPDTERWDGIRLEVNGSTAEARLWADVCDRYSCEDYDDEPPAGIYFARGPGIVRCSKCNKDGMVKIPTGPRMNMRRQDGLHKYKECPDCNPLGLTEPELVPEDCDVLEEESLGRLQEVAAKAPDVLKTCSELVLIQCRLTYQHATGLRLIYQTEDGAVEREDILRQ